MWLKCPDLHPLPQGRRTLGRTQRCFKEGLEEAIALASRQQTLRVLMDKYEALELEKEKLQV